MIAAITPTGARKAQFELCAKWMLKQTYPDEVLWIIIDDAIPVTTNNVQKDFRDKWLIKKIYPEPKWMGSNTQARNIKAGIDFLKINYSKEQISAIFIIEDDDYYKPCYLEKMMSKFGSYWLVGETNTIYYNVQWRRHVTNPNRHHASLFQTAFTWDSIPILESCYKDKFIDAALWTRGKNKFLFFDGVLSVGMKGMPGRGGIGAGHKLAMQFNADIEMKFLKKLIGNDIKFYVSFFNDHYQKGPPLFIKRTT
jgi:hypothetical protein